MGNNYHFLNSLFWITAIVWFARHSWQLFLSKQVNKYPVIFVPIKSRTKAWYFYILYLISFINAYLKFDSQISTVRIFSLVTILLGSSLSMAAIYYLASSYSEEIEIRQNFKLIKTGPYKIYKHPMRAGLIIEMAGLTLASGNNVGIILLIIFCVLSHIRNNDENIMLDYYSNV